MLGGHRHGKKPLWYCQLHRQHWFCSGRHISAKPKITRLGDTIGFRLHTRAYLFNFLRLRSSLRNCKRSLPEGQHNSSHFTEAKERRLPPLLPPLLLSHGRSSHYVLDVVGSGRCSAVGIGLYYKKLTNQHLVCVPGAGDVQRSLLPSKRSKIESEDEWNHIHLLAPIFLSEIKSKCLGGCGTGKWRR